MAKDYSGEEYEQINRLAEELKFSSKKLSAARKATCNLKMYEGILNLRKQSSLNLALQTDETIYDEKRRIELEAISETYAVTLNNFGKLDKVTGERIPFTKLFFTMFHFKKNDIIRETYGDENIYRKKIVKTLLKQLTEKYAAGKVELPKNLLKKDAIVEFCENLGVPLEEYKPLLKEVFENMHTSDFSLQENAAEVSEQTQQGATDISNTMMLLFDVVDKIMQDTKVPKLMQDYVKYYVTLRAVDAKIDMKLGYEDYFDYQFRDFIIRRGEVKEQYILGEYIGRQPETVRKNLNKAQALLIEYMSKK